MLTTNIETLESKEGIIPFPDNLLFLLLSNIFSMHFFVTIFLLKSNP